MYTKTRVAREPIRCAEYGETPVDKIEWHVEVSAYNLLHLVRGIFLQGEEVRRSIEWLTKRPIKVGADVSYHAGRWLIRVASAFPSAHHYRAAFG